MFSNTQSRPMVLFEATHITYVYTCAHACAGLAVCGLACGRLSQLPLRYPWPGISGQEGRQTGGGEIPEHVWGNLRMKAQIRV